MTKIERSFFALGMLGFMACSSAPAAESDSELLARGEKLVRLGGCGDCHTPMRFDKALGMPVPIQERALSGHPEGASDPTAAPGGGDQAVIGPTFTSFKVPFGIVYSANLTPDKTTGLGSWTVREFIAALRTGRHRGDEHGRPILPPMPWQNISTASDDELRAMFRYLQSVPAIRNQVPEPQVAAQALEALATSYAARQRTQTP